MSPAGWGDSSHTSDESQTHHQGPSLLERSATIVWKVLYDLGIEERTILWNALPLHPHEPGNEQSNRTPTSARFKFGEPALQMLVEEFPSATVVAVGKNAERLLNSMDIDYEPVRHPAFGGAPNLRNDLKLLVAGPGELLLSRSVRLSPEAESLAQLARELCILCPKEVPGRLERPAGVLQRAVYATDLGFGFVLAFGCLLCFAANSAATALSTFSTSTR